MAGVTIRSMCAKRSLRFGHLARVVWMSKKQVGGQEPVATSDKLLHDYVEDSVHNLPVELYEDIWVAEDVVPNQIVPSCVS